MAEASNRGFERLNDALRNLDDQLQELRERVDDQVKRFESKLQERREELRVQLSKTGLVKRTRQVRKDIEEQVEQRRGQLYDAFGIASRSEIQKLDRKLNTISKKLNELARQDRFAAEVRAVAAEEPAQQSETAALV
ncbi:MAG: hypothetical protein V3V67_10290 [Myxococcota bacterium]